MGEVCLVSINAVSKFILLRNTPNRVRREQVFYLLINKDMYTGMVIMIIIFLMIPTVIVFEIQRSIQKHNPNGFSNFFVSIITLISGVWMTRNIHH